MLSSSEQPFELTLVTPTGGRPEAFDLCLKYVSRFVIEHPTLWAIMDDVGDVVERLDPSDWVLPNGVHVVPYRSQAALNNVAKSLSALLRIVSVMREKSEVTGPTLVIEDDDWYHPQYVRCLLSLFQAVVCEAETPLIVGFVPSTYYNVKNCGIHHFANEKHASLCNTAVSSEGFQHLVRAAETCKRHFVDDQLWNKMPETQLRRALCRQAAVVCREDSRCLSLGIKGMPGRNGHGCGHRLDLYKTFDNGYDFLREVIGDDYRWYVPWRSSTSAAQRSSS